MSETQSQGTETYKDAHPDAVEDITKARFMAEMMNPHETKAAELRKELSTAALNAAQQTDTYHHGKPLVEMGVAARNGKFVEGINEEQDISDRKAHDASSIYDALQSTKR